MGVSSEIGTRDDLEHLGHLGPPECPSALGNPCPDVGSGAQHLTSCRDVRISCDDSIDVQREAMCAPDRPIARLIAGDPPVQVEK